MEKMINDIIEWRTKLYFISDFILWNNGNPKYVRSANCRFIKKHAAMQILIPLEVAV